MRVLPCVLAATLYCAPSVDAQAQLPRILANDNWIAAGRLENGVLTLELEVVRGMWHPDRDDEPGVDILAFAERGRAPSIPSPLVRVPVGTRVRTTITNTLTDSAIVVWGLSGARTAADTVRILPGETRLLTTEAAAAGTFLYRASTNTGTGKQGEDRMLAGAFIVDRPGVRADDRVLVLLMWVDTVRLRPFPGAVDEIPTINGKAWPNTERLTYDVGDTITWRIVNGSFDTHPMHLHGTYFDVLSHGTAFADTLDEPGRVRKAVTERLLPQQTRMIRWVAPRPGTWLFHCHLTFHVMPHPPLGPASASDAQTHPGGMLHGMGGLVLATRVRGEAAADRAPRRTIRLLVEQYDSIPGDFVPPFSYELDEARRMTIPGPPIVVHRDEPLAINVVNRAKEPTSVHWHGLEIESYYDGVPGVGGTPSRVTPMIAPGDSFLVKMTPPRAGTFIYHSHADEAYQQGGGLYGAFVVLPPGATWDAEHERIVVLASPRDTGKLTINGGASPTVAMRAGETYRIRMINITLDRPNIIASLLDGGQPEIWTVIAKDGADLPAEQAGVRQARLPISIGETYDLLYTPATPGMRILEVRTAAGEILRSATFVVGPRR